MRKMVKMLVYSPLVLASLLVAAVGIGPASYLNFYQPAPPASN